VLLFSEYWSPLQRGPQWLIRAQSSVLWCMLWIARPADVSALHQTRVALIHYLWPPVLFLSLMHNNRPSITANKGQALEAATRIVAHGAGFWPRIGGVIDPLSIPPLLTIL